MDRRKFLELLSAALPAISTANAGIVQATPDPAAGDRPNFLFLIADDLMFRTIGAINNPEVHTPNLDRLVRSGCHFTHCFHQGSWTGAVCVASRTMLNTGLTSFRAQHALPANQSASVPVWGQTLRAHGYDTFITGKWHLDAVSLQRSFAKMGPVGPGFLDSIPDMYDRPAPGNTWTPSNRELKGHWLPRELWDDDGSSGIEHSSSLYADAAVNYLKGEHGGAKVPFFMYVGFNAPHDPRQSPEEFLQLYPVESVQVPPNFLPQHPFDQGDYKTRDELLAPFPRTEFDVKTHRREYYAIISHMDAQVGRILDALDSSGQASRTYVILTADHGLAVGEHGLMGKQNQYECSMRMPLIVRGPGIKAGKVVDELVYQHCMYATTCELAGIPVPPHVAFPSLAPMLREGAAKPLYDAVFGWLNVLQRSVRTKRHKLIFYTQINRYQLFDLEKDPWEMHDLIEDAAYQTIRTEMVARLKQLQVELNDPLDIDHPPHVHEGNSY
jgi:arylsulfatase A-like enzyme